jgi:hypothetical protein
MSRARADCRPVRRMGDGPALTSYVRRARARRAAVTGGSRLHGRRENVARTFARCALAVLVLVGALRVNPLGVNVIRHKLDRVTRPRLENDLQRRFRIDVIELDGFTDPAAH